MDKRLIEKVAQYSNEQFLRLEAFTFNQKNTPNKRELGLIAQEVQVIEPLLIKPTVQGYLTIDYQGLTVALFSVVKDQQKQLEDLKREVINLKNKKAK